MKNCGARHHSRADSRSTRLGTAAVELAVVLPVSITLTIGCADFARVIHAQIALSNACRVGADYGATNRFTEDTQESWSQRLREVVMQEAQTIPSFSSEEFLMDVDVTESPYDTSLVSVTCHYNFQTVVSWPGMPSVIVLRHRFTEVQYQ